MPGFDRTGPQGAGPMTGRRAGRCAPAGAMHGPVMRRGCGFGRGGYLARGFRRGMGLGYGRGFGSYSTDSGSYYPSEPVEEIDALKTEADYLKNALNAVKDRIRNLEHNDSESESAT